VGGLAVAGLLACGVAAASAGVPGFEARELPIEGRDIFDLGVADVDDDADLDLFTTNHLSRESLLVNDGAAGFTERLHELGLAQTRAFPGWEERAGPGPEPGLHIYHRHSALHLRTKGDARVRGSVAFLLPTRANATGGARAAVHRRSRPGADAFVAEFRLGPDSHVRLDPARMAHPFTIRISRPFPLDDVHVGASEAHPRHRRFVLQLRDRHSMVWADLAGDEATDVFIVRGGLQGEIAGLAGAIRDELLLGDGGRFAPAPRRRVPEKGTCRGRAAGAADFTGDGRLDLFATCRGAAPNLYRGTATGFDRQPPGELDAEALRWLELDGDARPEALAAYPGRFATFDFRRGRLRESLSIAARHGVLEHTGFAPGDADGDGDLDVYAWSPTGSTLLRWAQGRLRASNPASAGLPAATRAAAWCDLDNDGLQDLVSVPGGVFRQVAPQSFQPMGELSPVAAPRDARLACADLDSDGSRDVVVAARPPESRRIFETAAYLGGEPEEHWLEVDLEGPARNRQGIGARVTVRSGGLTQVQWAGQNDTSLYSQGHYRTYFGLAGNDEADVTVRWPDGEVSRAQGVAADRLLEIER
jgi:hypothetical protein